MISDELKTGFSELVKRAGTQISIQYFGVVPDEIYDDAEKLIKSGATLWTSGIVLPIRTDQNSSEEILMQQGRLLYDDMKLYVVGDLALAGSDMQVKIGMGSPGTDKYMTQQPKTHAEVASTNVYKKVYLRRLTNGSFFGE